MDTICLPIALVILILMLRSFRLLLITVFCVGTSITTSFLILYPIAKWGIDTVTFAPSVMMSICLALSIDYSLFLLSRFREELVKGSTIGRAVYSTTLYSGRIITLSGSILTISFLSNLFMNNNMLLSLGISSAIATLTNLIVNITTIPSFLFLLPQFFADFSYCGIGTCLTRFCPSSTVQRRLHRFGAGEFRTKREIVFESDSYKEAEAHPENIISNPVADPNKNLWFGWGTTKDKGKNPEVTPLMQSGASYTNYSSTSDSSSDPSASSSSSSSSSSDLSREEQGNIQQSQEGRDTYSLALLLEQRKSNWFRMANCTTYPPMSVVVIIIILGCTMPFAYFYMFKMERSLDNMELLAQGSDSLKLFDDLEIDFSGGMILPIKLVVDARAGVGTWNNQFFCWGQNLTHVLEDKFPQLVDPGNTLSPVFPGQDIPFIMADALQSFNDCSILGDQAGLCEGYKLSLKRYAADDINTSFSFAINTKVNPMSTDIYDNLPKLYQFAQQYLDNYPTPQMYDAEDSDCKLTPEGIKQLELERIERERRKAEIEDKISKGERLTLSPSEKLNNPFLFNNYMRKIVEMNALKDRKTNYKKVKFLTYPSHKSQSNSDDDLLKNLSYPFFSNRSNITMGYDGMTVTQSDSVREIYDILPYAILISLCIVFVVVGFIFRSIFVPLRTVFSLGVTMLTIFGMLVIIFQYKWLKPFIDFMGDIDSLYYFVPVFGYSLIIGLALDYDIFLFYRIAEFRDKGYTDRAAIVKATSQSGSIITAAGLVMAVAFFGLMFSTMVVLIEFGCLLVLTVLLDTFVIRVFLVPAICTLLGPINWWPGKRCHATRTVDDMLDQLVDDADSEGAEGTSIANPPPQESNVKDYSQTINQVDEKAIEEEGNKKLKCIKKAKKLTVAEWSDWMGFAVREEDEDEASYRSKLHNNYYLMTAKELLIHMYGVKALSNLSSDLIKQHKIGGMESVEEQLGLIDQSSHLPPDYSSSSFQNDNNMNEKKEDDDEENKDNESNDNTVAAQPSSVSSS